MLTAVGTAPGGKQPFLPEELRSVVYEIDGKLFWRVRRPEDYPQQPGVDKWNARHANHEVHEKVRGGRGKVRILQHWLQTHRVVWTLHKGSWPEHTIDHINGDAMDNRIANLRDIPLIENIRAYTLRRFGDHPRGTHIVKVRCPAGRRIYVGNFASKAEAAAALRAANAVVRALCPPTPAASFSPEENG